MYTYAVRESLEKDLRTLAKKNPEQLRRIGKKIEEITSSEDAHRYKNLKRPLNHLKRVHIDSSFVLVFSVHDTHIIFEAFDHDKTCTSKSIRCA